MKLKLKTANGEPVKKGKHSAIYKIINIANNKIYIGSSVDVMKRYNGHLEDLNNNKHRNQLLQRAYNKYGKNSFEFTILLYLNKDSLIEKEQEYIDLYQATNRKYGFNICPVAGTTLGVKRPGANIGRILSEETKRKIANSVRGFKHSLETKERMSETRKGKKKPPMSEEQKQKLSILKTGKILSNETKLKIGIASKGNQEKERLQLLE